MKDTVKMAVATAIFQTLTQAASEGRLVSWPCEVSRLENLQATVWVRPEEGQPRRMFIVQVKEVV